MVIEVHGWTAYDFCACSTVGEKYFIRLTLFLWSRCKQKSYRNPITSFRLRAEIPCRLSLKIDNHGFTSELFLFSTTGRSGALTGYLYRIIFEDKQDRSPLYNIYRAILHFGRSMLEGQWNYFDTALNKKTFRKVGGSRKPLRQTFLFRGFRDCIFLGGGSK